LKLNVVVAGEVCSVKNFRAAYESDKALVNSIWEVVTEINCIWGRRDNVWRGETCTDSDVVRPTHTAVPGRYRNERGRSINIIESKNSRSNSNCMRRKIQQCS